MSFIKLSFNGKEYKLGFSKATVTRMERSGFKPDSLSETPTTSLPILFYGAFLKYQPKMKKEDTDRFLGKIRNSDGLVRKLVELYDEPANAMLEEPAEDDPNVATWEEVKE